MNAVDWSELERGFQALLDAPPEDRPELFEGICAGKEDLRRELTSLLAAYKDASVILASARQGLRRAAGEIGEADSAASWRGKRFGSYTVLGRLGRGGMATVLLGARADEAYEHTVAIKIPDLPVSTGSFRRRFQQERQILAQLEHPYIARLLDGGATEDNVPFLVMEVVRGKPVDEHCDRLRLSVNERIALFLRICEAVEFAHRNLVIHRDLKPSNILVAADGNPKLLDFGIAKLLTPGSSLTQDRTMTGMRPMTPGYASPEQIAGGTITTAADIYALGALLFRLLTGSRPFEEAAGNPAELHHLVSEADPPLPSQRVSSGASKEPTAYDRSTTPRRLQRHLAGDLDAIVIQALRRKPEERYPSVAALAEDLRRHLRLEPVRARPAGWSYRTGKFFRRHRWGVAVSVAGLILAGVFVALLFNQIERTQLQHQRSEEVVRLLLRVFEGADPNQAQGDEITVREVLEKGTERVRSSLEGQPALRAQLLEHLAQVHQGIGQYPESTELLREALVIRRQSAEPGELARTLFLLAKSRLVEGEHGEARQLLGEARTRVRGTTTGGKVLQARVLSELVRAMRLSGDFEDAVGISRESLRLNQQIHSPGSEDYAAALAEVGSLAMDLGNYEEAEDLQRKALEIYRERFQPPHTRLSHGANELALVLERRGKLEEAEELYREALEMAERLYEEDHSEIATSILNLGNILATRGDLINAEALLRRGLEIDRRTLGESHPFYTASLSNLALVLLETEGPRDAAVLLRKALATERKSLGNDHPDIALTMNNLGRALVESGEWVEAETLLSQALEIHRLRRGAGHREEGVTLRTLGALAAGRGRWAEAESRTVMARRILAKAVGESSQETLSVDRQLAWIWFHLGKVDQAQALVESLLETGESTVGGGHPAWARILMTAARIEDSRGDFRQAESLARRALAVRRGVTDEGLLGGRTRQILGTALAAQGRHREAAETLERSLENLRDALGEDSVEAQKAAAKLRSTGL